MPEMTKKLCVECKNKPVYIKKRNLCRRCYNIAYRRGKMLKAGPMSHEGWVENLIGRYGDEIIESLNSLRTNPYTTLDSVGEKFGFTREYARQIYQKYFNENYRVAWLKQNELKKIETSCFKDPRNKVKRYKIGSLVHKGAEVEKLFLETCERIGMCVRPSCNQSCDLIVNGFRVEIKSANVTTAPSPGAKARYYTYNITKKEADTADFFALYQKDYDLFYIIPNGFNKDGKSKAIYINTEFISTAKTAYKTNWSEYLNRYDLLIPGNKIIGSIERGIISRKFKIDG